MTDKTDNTAHAEITAPISADLREIDDAALPEMPEPGKYVLAWMEGKAIPIRAMWAPAKWLEADDECPEDWAEYDESKDQFFCPEGWYENNAHEDTHWRVTTPVVAWIELPAKPDAAAPSHAVASSITIDLKQAAELLEMFGGEPAEVTLIEGPGHNGEGLYAYYSDLPEEGAEFLGKPDNEALPAAPAQEHATQLAGQGLRQGVWLKPARAGRVYVAGPMTGLPEFNFPAFNAKAAELRACGWHVENPAEHGHVEGAEWADYLHYDIGRMATCCAIHLLPGWSRSRGAALEVHIASALGLEFQYAEGAERAAPAQAQEDATIVWPKSRDVGRIGDMSTTASLRVGLDGDNDSYVNVWDENGGGSIEFCTPGAGGGKSRRTRVALLALMVAMEADNAEDPRRDWWAARAAQGGAA